MILQEPNKISTFDLNIFETKHYKDSVKYFTERAEVDLSEINFN